VCDGDVPCGELGMPFDRVSWDAGYRYGYRDGRHDGESLAEQATREHFLRTIDLWGVDLKLNLLDVSTPADAWRAISLLLAERRRG
jgi:hypothetical protein